MTTSVIGKNEFISDNYGYTLIEMLSVMLILAALAAISIPAISKTAQSYYFRNNVKQLQALLEYVKKTAVIEERAYKFRMDSETNTCTVFYENAAAQPEVFTQKNDSLMRYNNLLKGIFIKTGDSKNKIINEITFYPDGMISAAEFYLFDLKNNTAKVSTTLSGEILTEFLK